MQYLSVILAHFAVPTYNEFVEVRKFPTGIMSRIVLLAVSVSLLLSGGLVFDKAHAGGKDALANSQNEALAAAVVAQSNKNQADAQALQDTPPPKKDPPPPPPSPGPPL